MLRCRAVLLGFLLLAGCAARPTDPDALAAYQARLALMF